MMNSFSQGIFVFKNGLLGAGTQTKKKKSLKLPIPQTIFDFDDTEHLWNNEYERTWNFIRTKVDEIQANNNDGHLNELCDFVSSNNTSTKNDIVTNSSDAILLRVAAVLTGINKPDHHLYFKLLANTMSKKKIARTVFLPARDCPNVRTAIETLVSCFLCNGRKHNYQDDEMIGNRSAKNVLDDSSESVNDTLLSDDADDNGDDDDDEPPMKLRRSQHTLDVLRSWYNKKYDNDKSDAKPQLVVIMPNFEEFKTSVIKDLIQILSNHCEQLPFIVILGVATSTTTLLNTLSFTETTRIKLRAFSGQPPNQILDQIFDNIILTPKCPFQLSSHLLEYLKSVFIFYDLTVKNFLRSVNYCLLDQYSHGNAYSICSITFKQARKNILKMKRNDIDTIRRLPSFRPYVESILAKEDRDSAKLVIAILDDDDFFQTHLIELVRDIYVYLWQFYGYIRLLWVLVKDLPNSPMGKRLSDIYMYCHASQKNVTTTEEFVKCWQILGMLSKDELIQTLEKCQTCLNDYDDTYCDENDSDIDETVRRKIHQSFDIVLQKLQSLITDLKEQSSIQPEDQQQQQQQQQQNVDAPQFKSRTEYYQLMYRQKRAKTGLNNLTCKALDFLRFDVFEKYLPSHDKAPPLLELFVYSDCDQIRSHLRGTSRSAIHKGLTDPHCYLQCNCCTIENRSQLLSTMPDNSIAYGLLLESGQQVNIYDWMSAFNAIVGNYDDDHDDCGDIPAEIQARFTRARAELQFMGFTKNSKRKTDHVTRTTW